MKTLYDQDYAAWIEETTQHLKDRNLEKVDWEHLIEELEAMGASERRQVDSYLEQLLIHLLLYTYWNQPYSLSHWVDEIDNFRAELGRLLESKTLYNYALNRFEADYARARKRASRKSGIEMPITIPWVLEQVLDEDWLP